MSTAQLSNSSLEQREQADEAESNARYSNSQKGSKSREQAVVGPTNLARMTGKRAGLQRRDARIRSESARARRSGSGMTLRQRVDGEIGSRTER